MAHVDVHVLTLLTQKDGGSSLLTEQSRVASCQQVTLYTRPNLDHISHSSFVCTTKDGEPMWLPGDVIEDITLMDASLRKFELLLPVPLLFSI